MPRKKRPQHLEAVVDIANRMLRNSTCSKEVREGIIALTSGVLHASDTYRGWRHLDATEVPEGHLPGIVRNVRDVNTTNAPHDFPDETRREYY
jgi:hypothetical protein